MRAGTLRERVTIQRPSIIADAAWGPQPTFVDAFQIYASIIPEKSWERMANEAVHAATRYLVSVRYRSDITTENRILYRGKILDIESCVDIDGRRREMEIIAVEHIQNG